MEKNQLIYVIEVANCKSITKAAEKLHISQPSLSNQIIHLEKELGIPLFERIRKRVYLTEAGEAFIQNAEKIISSFNELGQLMDEYAQQRIGKLRIGALSVMCALKIPEMIHAFTCQNSSINISLLESGSAALLKSLERNDIDAAFVLLDSPKAINETFTAIHLFDSDVCAAVNISHPKSQNDCFTLADLTEVPLIVTTESFNLSAMITSRMEAAGLSYQVTNICNQIDSCLALVDKNMGVTFCTRETAAYFHFPGVRLIPLAPPLMRSIYLVYKKNPDYYPVLKTFLAFAVEFMNHHLPIQP